MDETRTIQRDDGSRVVLPSTRLYRADTPEPIECAVCGAQVTATAQTNRDLLGRILWQWNYCDCMRAALPQVEAATRQEEAEERRQIARDQWTQDQHHQYHGIFPQWEQSRRVPEQTFDRFRVLPGNRAAYEFTRDWATRWPATGFILRGPAGTGKTHLVRAVAHTAIANQRHFLYTSVPFLLEHLRPDQRKDAPSMAQVLDLHVRAPLVVWDDCGAEKHSEWTLERLYLLLDARYEAQLPLVATTNLSLDQLKAKWGERNTSRLWEMCEVWAVEGDDQRLETARRRVLVP